MADTKITALTALTAADPANDVIPIVDVSDTSMAASGTTKKISVNNILGASGTATLASATITGDLTVDTSTLKVDSANDRVGIQSTLLNSRLTVRAGTIAGIDIYRDDANANFSGIRFKGTANSTVNAQIGWNGTQLRLEGTDEFLCATNSSDRFRISSTGVFTFETVGGVAGTAMTLNSTGLGIGGAPISGFRLNVNNGDFRVSDAQNEDGVELGWSAGAGNGFVQAYNRTTSAFKDLVLNAAVTINSAGNVGIGVTPSAWQTGLTALQFAANGVLYANGTNSSFFGNNYFTNSAGDNKYLLTNAATAYGQVAGAHQWFNAPSGTAGNTITFTQAMTLDASGNLLVGTTSLVGTERLIVTKTTVGSVLARFVNTNTTVDTYGIAVSYSASTPNDASHYFLGCFDSTTSRAFIYANGGLANYSANNVNLSDARTKTDIKPLTSYWNKIKALELVTFKYKDQTHDDDNIGLISQQVESVAPEFVSNEGFGETPADGVPLKSIYTTDLYHAAIKALQEAMTRIEVLESKLA